MHNRIKEEYRTGTEARISENWEPFEHKMLKKKLYKFKQLTNEID
jgi:hypothetical protein